jgi:hypothetical protein
MNSDIHVWCAVVWFIGCMTTSLHYIAVGLALRILPGQRSRRTCSRTCLVGGKYDSLFSKVFSEELLLSDMLILPDVLEPMKTGS